MEENNPQSQPKAGQPRAEMASHSNSETPSQKQFKLSTPASIIIAAILIVGGIFASKLPMFQTSAKVAKAPDMTTPTGMAQSIFDTKSSVTIPAIVADDHTRGDVASSKITIVEYSDLQCPFCQRFHGVMLQLMQDYPGKIAWIYRHYPLESIHPDARPYAIASECAAMQGGNATFWNFVDGIFANSNATKARDARIASVAKVLGLDAAKLASCQKDPATDALVKADIDGASSLSISGTPVSYIIDGKNEYTVEGAYPIEAMKIVIDKLVK